MKKLLLTALVFAFGITSSPLAAAQTAQPNVDNTRDCDTVAIIKCGTFSEAELKNKYEQNEYGDLRTIFQKFEIDEVEMHSFVDGVVWRDGRVTVNGKTVATEAQTAGRWNNPKADMKRIGGTQRAYVMDTRHMVSEGQTAMVNMVDGQFEFAIIKTCGNPVAAKPVRQPKPQPVVKHEKVERPPRVVVKQENTQEVIHEDKVVVEEEEVIVEEEEVFVEEEAPVVVAATGPAEFAVGGLGLSSLTAASYYWIRSRRRLHGDL